MKMHRNILAILAISSFLFVGCNQSEKEPSENDMLTTQIDSIEFDKMKAELKRKYSVAIDNLDTEIEVLDAKLQSTEENSKAEIEDALSELKSERDALNERMKEVGSALEGTWNDWQTDAENLLEHTMAKADSVKQSIKDTIAAM